MRAICGLSDTFLLGQLAWKMFQAMEFDFLFDPRRQLLSIGYRVAEESLDPDCYDLLASEAPRLASFVAIAIPSSALVSASRARR